MAVGSQLFANALYYFLQRGIFVGRHLPHDLGTVFLSQPDLILFGHQYEVAVTGYRVGGAGVQQWPDDEQQQDRPEQAEMVFAGHDWFVTCL